MEIRADNEKGLRGAGDRLGMAVGFLVCAFFLLVFWKIFRRQEIGSWQLSELEINYRGGFVRRGLLGESLFHLTGVTGVSVIALAKGLFLLLSALQAILFVRLAAHFRPLPLRLALLLSPACVLFTVYDPGAYWRKEIFVSLLLVLHATLAIAWGTPRRIDRYTGFLRVGLPALLVVSTLVHESQIFFLPAHLLIARAAWHRLGLQWRRANDLCLLLPSLAAAALVFAYPGTDRQVAAICASWASIGQPADCGGGMSALAWPLGRSLALSGLLFRDPPSLLLYATYLLLSLLPFAAIVLARPQTPGATHLPPRKVLVAVAAALPLALCFIGWDWGRWIHLGIMALFSVFVTVREDAANSVAPAERTRFPRRVLLWVLVAVYVGSWSMQHSGQVRGTRGQLHSLAAYICGLRPTPPGPQ